MSDPAPNAIQRLRAMGADFQDILSGPEVDRWMEDVAAVDDLYQAAKEVWDATEHLTNPDLVRTGEASEQEAGIRMTLAVQALAAAVRRVDGEATESTVPWDKRFGA